jgi:hypothetical protein
MMNWAATNNIRHIPHNDKSFRDQLPPAWAFYCDDDGLPTSQSRTTAREWELKSHEPTCIFGTRSIIVKDTQQLLFVREQLGDLPTNAPSSYKPADDWTPTQAAFEKAWKPYEKSLGDVASGAATIYEAIKAESYFDFETSELLKNNSRPR